MKLHHRPVSKRAAALSDSRRLRRAPVREFVEAAIRGDRLSTRRLTAEFLSLVGARITVFADLFDGAQRYISDRWHVGEATAADEYRVAESIADALTELPAPPQPDESAPCALLVTLQPEAHDLGVRLVADALQDEDWNVEVALSVSPAEVVERARTHRCTLVGISSTFATSATRIELASLTRALHELGKAVIVGGELFARWPHLAEQIGADMLATDARVAAIMARRLRGLHRRAWPARRAVS